MSTPMPLDTVLHEIHVAAMAAKHGPVRLLAISKTQPVAAIAALAEAGQQAFGENYVQEAAQKIEALQALRLEWHLVGHLQSNKAELAARRFDWIQTVDRPKLVDALARFRSVQGPPLNVLIQVNIDAEISKSGCTPEKMASLAAHIVRHPQLCLRGLMAIPSPNAHTVSQAFTRMRTLFDTLRQTYPQVDTLSLGMSADFKDAIACGATMVRLGSSLFGPRNDQPPSISE